MVKFRVRGVKGQVSLIKARAARIAREAIVDPKLARRIKNELIDPIRKQGILPDGSKVPSFKTAWAKRRRRLADFNKVSKFYQNFLSNLSFSGQFLKSFQSKVIISGRKVTYLIFPAGRRRGYNLVKGGKSKPADNAAVGQGQIDQGRDYTIIGDERKKRIKKLIIGRIRREFKLRLNK